MIRRDGECGQNATWYTRVTDPVTGRWRLGAWCGRHRAFYEEASRVERLRRDTPRRGRTDYVPRGVAVAG